MTLLSRPAILFSIAFMFLCTFGSCDTANNAERAKTGKEGRALTPEIHEDTLATVGGIRIGKLDVDSMMKRNPNFRKAVTPMRKPVLELIIQQELMSQKAVELGLDKDLDEYQEQAQRLEAQLNAFKRRILSKQFRKLEIVDKADIHEDEMKAYFNENLHKIQREFHVGQIIYKSGEKAINDDMNDFKSGVSFEDAAKRRFPDLPKEVKRHPWDLGYIRWDRIPEAWQDVIYEMKKDEISGILEGPGKRFSMIKIIDMRENPDPDFEASKPAIERILKNKKIEALTNQWEKKLRDEMEIIYYDNTEKRSTNRSANQ